MLFMIMIISDRKRTLNIFLKFDTFHTWMWFDSFEFMTEEHFYWVSHWINMPGVFNTFLIYFDFF